MRSPGRPKIEYRSAQREGGHHTSRSVFRLYVAGDALNSAQALANLTAPCRVDLPNGHALGLEERP